MAVPVPSISHCVFNNNDFYQEPNELAFNQDTCCHLVICLRLIAFHCWTYLPTFPPAPPWQPILLLITCAFLDKLKVNSSRISILSENIFLNPKQIVILQVLVLCFEQKISALQHRAFTVKLFTVVIKEVFTVSHLHLSLVTTFTCLF